MDTEGRLLKLESKLRRTRMVLFGLIVCLLLGSTVAASSPFVDLVCSTWTVKSPDGKTVAEAKENGDLIVKGRLFLGESGRADLGKQVGELQAVAHRLDCGELHLHPNVNDGGLQNWKVTGGHPFKRRVKFAKAFAARPTVFVSVPRFNIHPAPGGSTQLIADVTDVTKDDFELTLNAWDGAAVIHEVRVLWVAISGVSAREP